jgi:site-specific DNA-methyltransferase (adenine-specific)/adenine-specific DNA-methyltransferase
MSKLSTEEIEFIAKCLKENKPLPDSYRYIIPFETKKEYELTYDGKEREEDILADTMGVPLQPVKTFGNGNGGWTNKLIFGDNLQVLKALMDDPEVYDKNTGRGKVRLIYIDPPFATRQEFRGSQDQKAYQDKIVGAQFLEFLRKRLVFLKGLLADDGSIYVHLDWKKGHYVKTLMDEVFGEHKFLNEVIWCYRERETSTRFYNRKHEVIFFYCKSDNYPFNFDEIRDEYSEVTKAKFKYKDEGGNYRVRAKDGRSDVEEGVDTYRQYIGKGVLPRDWTIMPFINQASTERVGFPTQKPEKFLARIVKSSSNPGDIVLDAFAGSGTTAAVAEKLGRKWIMIDCGKLAIYTMQKRLLNLREEIGNRGNPLKPKPFTLYNAGLYDYKMVKTLPWNEYREFVLKLFQCRDEKHRIAGVELDGYLGQDSVMVFNYKKHKDVILDRGFIDDLHKILGDKVGYKFFIVAPAASVMFFEDYIEKPARGAGKVQTKYFVLRIPYSIIDELHRKGFAHIKQPIREADVNDTIDAVGFDFIQTPDIECDYLIENKKGQMEVDKGNKAAVIKIKNFTSNILSKKPLKFKNRETLSMVMVDYDYNGKVFDFDDVFYAEDLKRNNWGVHFDADKIDSQIMIIYIDIFGNEKREVKKLSDFQRRAK